jgi:ribosomal protein S18 acetylase RimI-like enzyme
VIETLEVRRAGPEDVDEIVAILSEAAHWLLARGIEQWPDPFPRDRVEALAGRGDFYLAQLDGETAATFALLWSDPSFWGERPPDAGYVHALAVRREHAGRGLGARLIDWADREVAGSGRELLRLDCRSDNAALCRYYEALGFEPKGEVAVDEFVSMRYERRCGGTVRSGAGGGRVGTLAARSRERHARPGRIGSQRERGWPTDPTQEGGGALLG